MIILPRLPLVLTFVALTSVACSVENIIKKVPSYGTGPEIGADQIGMACSGVGTSPGDTVAFAHSDCPAGWCVADARTDFDTYCSADCQSHSCPTGFSCQKLTLSGDISYACLTDGSAAAGSSEGDAGADTSMSSSDARADASTGKIGTKKDKGVKSVDVNISSQSSYTCTETCTAAGGTCSPGNNGAGWVDYKYDDGTGTFSNQISCDETQDYATGNVTLEDMQCFCDGLTVPPIVSVTKEEGYFTCAAVCTSWSLTCSTERKGAAFSDATEDSVTTNLSCTELPPASTNHYECACD